MSKLLAQKQFFLPNPASSTEKPRYGLREHLATIFRHKTKVQVTILAALLVAGPGSFLLTKIYSTDIRFLIQSSRSPFSMSATLSGQGYAPMDFSQKDEVLTEVQIFTSPILLDKLVENLGEERVLGGMRGRWDWILEVPGQVTSWVMDLKPVSMFLAWAGLSVEKGNPHEQATQALRDHLVVDMVRQTHVFVATLDSPDPQFAADALNALAAIYLDHHVVVRKRKGAHEFFDDQSRYLRTQLDQAEQKLQAFKERWNIVSIEDQKSHLLDQIRQSESAMHDAQMAIAEADVRIAQLREKLIGQQESIPLTNVSERNPMQDQLKTRLAQLELELSQYVSGSSAATEIHRELASVRARIASESSKVTGSATTGMNQTYQELKKKMILDEGQRDSLRPRVAELRKQVKTFREALNGLDQHEQELRSLTRDAKIKQEAFDLYLKKEEESRINELLDQKGISNVSLIQPATVPQKAVRPRKMLNLVLGLLVGLVGGVGLAYMSEFMRRSLATKDEAEKALRRPVIGSIPFAIQGGGMAGRLFALQMRQLAQHVAKAHQDRDLRTLLVTSTLSGEGKSHITMALAHALNELRFRVLLIESVEPKNVTVLSTTNGSDQASRAGLLVTDSTRLPEISTQRSVSRMKFGDNGVSAVKYAEQLVEIVGRMQSQFDLVLIDGPALSSFPESRLLISKIGSTVLVVEAERTTCDSAAQSLAVIDGMDAHLLGIILNKWRQVIPSWAYDRWITGNGRLVHE
ncbi:MAG: GNVR domain-containing protein [Nitrospirota bacterium]